MTHAVLDELANAMVLGELLAVLSAKFGGYELQDHWTQGEFHHDVVLRVRDGAGGLPSGWLVVSTNCNGGVKEVLALREPPVRYGLWRSRCPDNPEFEGPAPDVVAWSRTLHWFDPCELLRPDARSEIREELRVRERGGGWTVRSDLHACGSASRRS